MWGLTGSGMPPQTAWNIEKWKPRSPSVYLMVKMSKGFGDVFIGLGWAGVWMGGVYSITILAHNLGFSLDWIQACKNFGWKFLGK